MKNIIFYFVAFMSLSSFAQTSSDSKTLKYFETCILNSDYPDNSVSHKYENDYRLIVWDDLLIKDYKYSNAEFDKLGYDFVKINDGDGNQSSKVYRNCSKGIVIEVTEWYNYKISISMQWYAPNVRNGIGELMFCQ